VAVSTLRIFELFLIPYLKALFLIFKLTYL